MLNRPPAERARTRELGFAQARSFSLSKWLDQLEIHYCQALALQEH